MASRIAVIVNPTAGHGRTGKLWPAVARAMTAEGLAFDATFTKGPGDASTLAADARRAGYEIVVSVGGDGTLNEVVNGLIGGLIGSGIGSRRDEVSLDVIHPRRPAPPVHEAPRDPAHGPPASDETATPSPAAHDLAGIARLTVGVISSGTGSDLVRSLRIPPGVAGVRVLASGQSRVIDLGLTTYRNQTGGVSRRYFVNAADLGIGAEVARRVNEGNRRLGGFLSFFLTAVAAIVTARFDPVEYSLDDGEARTTRAALIFAANGRFAGHAMEFAPRAELDDGLLDVVVLNEVSKPELLFGLLPRVYRGAHLGHPKVSFSRASRLRVASSAALYLEVDGEVVGQTPIEVSVLPRALRILAPTAGID